MNVTYYHDSTVIYHDSEHYHDSTVIYHDSEHYHDSTVIYHDSEHYIMIVLYVIKSSVDRSL